MAKFRKCILRAGKYHAVQNGKRVPQDFNEADIDNYLATGNKMVEAGLKIPGPFAHNPEAIPKPLSEEATFLNAGYWTKFEKGTENGQPALFGYIEADGDENDPNSMAGKIKSTVKEVSICGAPTWTDGLNRVWNNAPLHIALCTHPVMPGQSDFELVKDSFAMSLSMEDDCDIGELLKACEEAGIYLPPGVTKDTLPKMLLVSLKSKAMATLHTSDRSEVQQLPVYYSLENNDMPLTQAQAEALIATNAINPVTSKAFTMEDFGFTTKKPEPTVIQKTDDDSASLTKWKNVAQKLGGMLTATKRADLTRRVQALIDSGRIKPAQAKVLEPKIVGFQMSLNDAGEELVSDIESIIALLEAGEPEAPKQAANPSIFKFSTEPLPEGQGSAELTAEEEAQLMKDMLSSM